jgi:hypothetical protein
MVASRKDHNSWLLAWIVSGQGENVRGRCSDTSTVITSHSNGRSPHGEQRSFSAATPPAGQAAIVGIEGPAEYQIDRFVHHQGLGDIGLGEYDRTSLLDYKSALFHLKVTGLTALDKHRVFRSDRIGPRTVAHGRIESLHMELVLHISAS